MHILTKLSWFNRLYVLLWLCGAVFCATQSAWILAVLCIAIPLFTLAALVFAADSESVRISGAQPADERDERAIEWTFAVIGKVAVFAVTAAFIVAASTSVHGPQIQAEGPQAFAFLAFGTIFGTWAVAHLIALRRF